MGDLRPVAAIIACACEQPTYRATCSLCPWASDLSGTTRELAVLAAIAHAEAVHHAINCELESAGGDR